MPKLIFLRIKSIRIDLDKKKNLCLISHNFYQSDLISNLRMNRKREEKNFESIFFLFPSIGRRDFLKYEWALNSLVIV